MTDTIQLLIIMSLLGLCIWNLSRIIRKGIRAAKNDPLDYRKALVEQLKNKQYEI